MKILIYSSKYPPQIGGVEEVVRQLSTYWSSKLSVYVVTTLNLSTISSGLISKFIRGFTVLTKISNQNNVFVQTSFMSLPRSLFGYIALVYRFPASIISLRRSIKNINPDIINAHFLDDSLYYFYFSTLRSKKPIFLDIHGNELHLFSKSKTYRYFMQRVINKSKSVIVHSGFMKNLLLEKYAVEENKVVVVANGVDFKRFNSKDSTYSKGYKYFLYVGRLDAKKGIDILLKVFKNVESQISTNLVIVGGGSGEAKHGSINVDDLKKSYASNKIKFTGMLTEDDVVSAYKRAYFSVFPSRHEPFGIVALESVACGTPFIASSGGFVEIAYKTQAGLIFEKENIAELEQLLIKVDKNPDLRNSLREKGLDNITQFSWDNISNIYLEIFGL